MKDDGFTLIELLGVLIILSILGVLVSQIITERIKENNEKLESFAESVIISSAKEYLSNESNRLTKTIGKIYCISYSSLIQTEYLNEGMVPKIDKADYLKKYYVKATYNGRDFDYDMLAECTPN